MRPSEQEIQDALDFCKTACNDTYLGPLSHPYKALRTLNSYVEVLLANKAELKMLLEEATTTKHIVVGYRLDLSEAVSIVSFLYKKDADLLVQKLYQAKEHFKAVDKAFAGKIIDPIHYVVVSLNES